MAKKVNKSQDKREFKTALRVGDVVQVLCGGNSKSGRDVKDCKGKVIAFLPKKNRVLVEGVNYIKRHKRAMSAGEKGGIVTKEAAVNISNVMFYSEEAKRPVRLIMKTLDNGSKVRGYKNPQTGAFEQVA